MKVRYLRREIRMRDIAQRDPTGVRMALATQSKLHSDAFRLRYCEPEPWTLERIANQLNIGRERVRYLLWQAERDIRRHPEMEGLL